MFKSGEIELRSVIGSDASILFQWENNRLNWRVSDRDAPLSMLEIERFIEQQLNAEEIDQLDQFRFIIIESSSRKPLGTLDLYEIDWDEESAYVGILIADPLNRRKGAGQFALELALERMWNELAITTAFARIQPDNSASLKLFKKAGFKKKKENSDAQNQDAEYIEFVCDLENKW